MLKKITIITIALLSIFLVTGCDKTSQDKKTVTKQSIQDIYDRTVEIPSTVNEISTVGSATRLCAYAGIMNTLVSVTEADKENIARPYTIAYKDEIYKLPVTNNGNHLNESTVNKEELLKIKPDIILSTRSKEECQQLQDDTNIPVIGVHFQDEIFSEDVYNSIKIVGQVVGKTTEVDKTINYLKQTQHDIETRCEKIKDKAKVYRGAVNFKGSKGITGTISKYCIYENLNVINVADNNEINGAYDTTMEQILSWNPSYMFFDCTNKEKVNAQDKSSLAATEAFKNQQTHYIAPFNSNGTNIEYGLCELYYTGKTIYPDAFSDINLDEKFEEIFDKILGKKIYSELIAKGIYFGKTN